MEYKSKSKSKSSAFDKGMDKAMDKTIGMLRKNIDSQVVNDLVFDKFEHGPRLKKVVRIIKKICYSHIILHSIIFLTGILAFCFYENKAYIIYLGLLSPLQIASGCCGSYGFRKRDRSYIFALFILNVIWIIATLIYIFYFLHIVSEYSSARQEFTKDLFLHIILASTITISFTLFVLSFILFYYLFSNPK